jgi:tetratricopeptide (TPR) repeat protein
MGEDLYQAISAILFKAQLTPEAEALMVRAAGLFPASKDVHFHLAQLYLVSGKPVKALEVFEQLSRMKTPSGIDPAVDRLQQSVVYQKIGSIRAELADFEQALSAYKKALEFTPDSLEARLGLGDVYLREGKADDALAEYGPVAAASPQSVPAQFRIADANLRRGNYPEAAAAAEKALAIDPKHQRTRYIRATALLRMDRKEEGDRELELYQKLEAETRAERDRSRNVVVLNRGAAGEFLDGRPEKAIDMFLKIIETYPDVSSQYLNLGIVQSKLGRHQAAVDTFQKMLSLGLDDNFLVYRNLSQEYRLLGDMDASRRYEVVYLQNFDVALRDALEWNLE